jgi:hypothetical protein
MPVENTDKEANPKLIGQVNMISTRNVDMSRKYEPLSTYAGGSEEEMKEANAKNIEEGVNATVRKIPGGEFIMNAKIYMVDLFDVKKIAQKTIVQKSNGKVVSEKIGEWRVVSKNEAGSTYVVEGDVYGIAGNNQHRGFKLGDAVTWKNTDGKWVKGKITALKDANTCLVENEEKVIIEKRYDDIVKAQ